MKTLFNDVSEAIKSLSFNKWFDWDFEQLTEFEMPPVSYPCCLFSILNLDAVGESDPAIWDTSFRIRYAEKVLYKANSTTGQVFKDQALLHLDRVKLIVDAIEGMDSEYYSKPQMVSMHPGERADPRYYEIVFGCALYTYKAAGKTIAKPAIEVDVEIG